MKKFVTLLCAFMISIVGMAQTTYVTSSDFVDVVNPYTYICDDTDYFPNGWPNSAWTDPGYEGANSPFDCILTSTTIEVPATAELDSIYLNVTTNEMVEFINNQWKGVNAYSLWSIQVLGNDPPKWGLGGAWQDLNDKFVPGIEIINVYSGQKIYFKHRPQFALYTILNANDEESGAVLEGWVGINIDLTNGDEEDVNIGPGLYEVRIIKQVDEGDMYWAPNYQPYGDMAPGYVGVPDLPLALPEYYSFSLGANNGIPDFGFDTIKYAIIENPGAPIVWNPAPSYEFCEGIEFTIDGRYGPGGNIVPCTDNPDYTYYWQLQSGESWFDIGFECNYTFNPDEGQFYPAGEYVLRLKTVYLEGTEDEIETINNEFLLVINPAPEWDYGVVPESVLYNIIPGCELSFGVEAFNTTDNEYVAESYVWVENEDFGTNLSIDAVDTEEGSGFVATFCFNPFTIETDTVGSFFVTTTVIFEDYYGCSVMDTTYVVYIDSDGTGTWTPGDSLDFRNFIVIPEDTLETFVFDRLERQMKLYPNPTSGMMTMEHNFRPGSTLQIMTMTGELVRQEKLSSERVYLDVADLPQGIYLAVIYDEKERFTVRLVKQ